MVMAKFKFKYLTTVRMTKFTEILYGIVSYRSLKLKHHIDIKFQDRPKTTFLASSLYCKFSMTDTV